MYMHWVPHQSAYELKYMHLSACGNFEQSDSFLQQILIHNKT